MKRSNLFAGLLIFPLIVVPLPHTGVASTEGGDGDKGEKVEAYCPPLTLYLSGGVSSGSVQSGVVGPSCTHWQVIYNAMLTQGSVAEFYVYEIRADGNTVYISGSICHEGNRKCYPEDDWGTILPTNKIWILSNKLGSMLATAELDMSDR